MIADWYFDFVSPFAYLQSEQLASLAPRIAIRYRPVLFAGLLGANGQKGPAEIPAKRVFTYRFCIWQARKLGIALKFPHEHPFNPLPLLRLAIACDSTADAVHRIFRFVWRDGRLPDLPIEWAELASALGVPDAETRIASPEVKSELRRNTDEAIGRGVFGATLASARRCSEAPMRRGWPPTTLRRLPLHRSRVRASRSCSGRRAQDPTPRASARRAS
jgi:2-hydroxychromene-2-carboxylate isomerase